MGYQWRFSVCSKQQQQQQKREKKKKCEIKFIGDSFFFWVRFHNYLLFAALLCFLNENEKSTDCGRNKLKGIVSNYFVYKRPHGSYQNPEVGLKVFSYIETGHIFFVCAVTAKPLLLNILFAVRN